MALSCSSDCVRCQVLAGSVRWVWVRQTWSSVWSMDFIYSTVSVCETCCLTTNTTTMMTYQSWVGTVVYCYAGREVDWKICLELTINLSNRLAAHCFAPGSLDCEGVATLSDDGVSAWYWLAIVRYHCLDWTLPELDWNYPCHSVFLVIFSIRVLVWLERNAAHLRCLSGLTFFDYL